jgi:hypothetical protein
MQDELDQQFRLLLITLGLVVGMFIYEILRR